MQHLPWDYRVEFHQERVKIEVVFQPLLADIMASVKAAHNVTDNVPLKEASPEPHPSF